MGQRFAMALVIAIALPGSARAQCASEPKSATQRLVDTLSGLFGPSNSVEVAVKKNGVERKGKVEVKEASCGSTTVNVSGSVAGGAMASFKAGPFGAEGAMLSGVGAEYELTLPNDRWKDLVPPDPIDPRSLPEGASMILKREFFASLDMEATFKNLVASSRVDKGIGNAVSIKRLDGAKVQLTVGPYSVVKNEAMLGVGLGGAKVGVGRDDKLESGTARTFEYDLSKEEDRKAYQAALTKGVFLGSGPAGDTVEYRTYESQAGVRVKAGAVSAASNFGSSQGEERIVTKADGSKIHTRSETYGNTTLEVTRTYSPDGTLQKTETAITFSKISDYNGHLLASATGDAIPSISPGKGQYRNGLKLELSDDALAAIRDRAREAVRNKTASDFQASLAEATSPADLANRLFRAASGPYTRTFEDLFKLSLRKDGVDPLPGTLNPACPGAAAEPGATDPRSLAEKLCGANVARNDASKTPAVIPAPTETARGEAAGAVSAGMATP